MPLDFIDPEMPFASSSLRAKKPDELMPTFDAWKAAPSPQTSAALLKQVSPIIDTAMTSYGMGQGASSTLRARAKLIAHQAFGTYDPAKGPLKAHLMGQLRGLQRLAAQQNQIISIPERVAIQRQQLVESEDLLRDRLGRDPSDAEVADHTGLSRKRLGYIRQFKPPTALGTVTTEDEEGIYTPPVNQDPSEAWNDLVYYDLDPSNQLVMDYTLGMHGAPKLPPEEIARRLGVTVSAVSQRTAKIQKLLNEQYDLMGG
jgi:hypothetical protein